MSYRSASNGTLLVSPSHKTLVITYSFSAKGMEGGQALAEMLKVNDTLAALQLEGNGLDVDGSTAIADALKINNTLTDLNLKENSIGDDGTLAIAEALKTNRALNCLGIVKASSALLLVSNSPDAFVDLTGNMIGTSGVALADSLRVNTGLHYLLLNENTFYDEGATAIAEALQENTSLHSLELKDNCITKEVTTNSLAGNCTQRGVTI